MNAKRRKELEKALGYLNSAKQIIDLMKDEEQDAFDNMPEGLQMSEKGEAMEEAIENLEEALSSLEDVISSVDAVI
jgi:hypothetical protein